MYEDLEAMDSGRFTSGSPTTEDLDTSKRTRWSTKKELTKTSEIKDAFVLSYCADLIIRYNNLLNTVNAEEWTVNQVIEFLTTESQDICFSDYARIHINRMTKWA